VRSDSVTVYAVASIDPPTFTLDPGEACAGSRFVITANEYAHYHWSNGASTQSITVFPQVTTTYSLTVADEVGCESSGQTQVIAHPYPTAAFAPERFLTYLEDGAADVQFLDFSEGASSWLYDFGDQWSNSNTSIDPSPIHTYTHSGIYTVTQWVTSDFGCSDSVTHQVSIQKPFYFYVPNAFTPDGDGINEIWLPQGEGIDESNYVCMVFDRNGRLIFKTNSVTQGWDGRDQRGKAVPCASYVYVIQTSTMDATPKEYTGTVTVVR
jgi:gliding motility-associated-like protein